MQRYIDRLKQRHNLDENPYFTHLSDGSFSRDDFVETQIQFLFAIVFFSRPMLVLAARLPRPEQRFSLLSNAMEEHGNRDVSNSHESIFCTFLNRMGVEPDYIESRGLWPAVRTFNAALDSVCQSDDLYTGLAVFGMIEDLFSGISTRLGQTIVQRGWLPASELLHYNVHKSLDEEHAEEFYQMIRPLYGSSPRADYQIEQGLELGAHLFMTLYKELYASRQRRWQRQVGGPHSIADGWYLDSDAVS